MSKLIFVTGGVVSSLGKGLASASIGNLLESRGLKITFLKLDPYINVDPGTMNPYQHGEVYVTEDGAETDLDLGHYERYTSLTLTRENNYTTGRIYHAVITKERRGDYLGGTVQVVPHVTDEIKQCIMRISQGMDVTIVEIGGTVGDIESLPFLEAIRQIPYDVGRDNVLYVHLTLVPYIGAAGELKTKPTQHSVNCNVPEEAVITAKDVETIYEVPIVFRKEGLDELIVRLLKLETGPPNLREWDAMVQKIKHPKHEVSIALVGKYAGLKECYKSLAEALVHGGIDHETRVNVNWIESEEVERQGTERILREADGILIPGGFGARGIEGKIVTIQYAREHQIPFLGLCLGMQCATIEFARNVAGLVGANSAEFDEKTPHPVIHLMSDQQSVNDKGGTMRLGAYACKLGEGTLAQKMYGVSEVRERHRHRYEFNNAYREQLTAKGLILSGLSPDGRLVEIVELQNHPWFLATQFHPEYKSRPHHPHPLFSGFVGAALRRKCGH